ncbi:tetratricopeptide repeat protein [Ohtaekwangia kribbensis]|uniref:Tetratricopeptide repeat protein n=1 Tax=Ohtaekwangia kribbensis TaxID=688913 RepID=A0ABW3K8H8_9BACT
MTNYKYYIYYLINTISQRSILITFLVLLVHLSFGQNQSEIQLANEYLLKGDKKKAVELYRELSKQDVNNSFIYNNYINTLLDLGAYDEAQGFLKKLLKRDPENLQYKLDAGLVYVRSGDLTRADRYFRELIAENKTNVQRIKLMAEFFSSRSLLDYGILSLTESRNFLNNSTLFSLDLAMLYRLKGNQDKMVQEYLNYVTQTSANIQYVKNVMQALLTEPEELTSLEKLLYDRVQEFPDVEVYSDLLIWVTMQQKNFYASFVQARAYDKRYKHDGEKSMEVAKVALDNEDYDNAAKIYRYIIREYRNTPNYLMATLGLIRTREARLKKIYPVNTDSVKTLVTDYRKFIKQYPDNANALEAARSEALLFANYLDQKDSAVKILNKLIANPRTSLYLRSKAKLDLGDIYLLKAEPWESTLLYSQVEKTQKENPIGYEAKLKNAKLSYYKGDFRLAQEHLDILKEATTREIANDALDLSMRIKENIALDSAGEALQEYASIELTLYQNKTDEALARLDKLKQGFSVAGKAVSNQTILDDVYWLEANIRMKRGEFDNAIGLLQKIRDEFADDILADDAYFLQGEIYERQLKNKEKAMEIYRDFLNKYPGSVYAAEARKRYRTMRGDFAEPAQPRF